MKLFTYGDSWTEGVGGNVIEERKTNIPEEQTNIRHKYCWPKHLSELLNCDFQNDGVGAYSNNAIFNTICQRLKNNSISENDFVIVMWSSSLRDPLPFFHSEDDFFIWGKRYKTKNHLFKHIFNKTNNDLSKFNRIEKDFRDYYIKNLYTDTYYNILNQNYILHLQFLFKQLGIRYLFCDAFDNMITNDIVFDLDKTNLIDSSRYWGFKENTFANFLINTKRKDVWEDGEYWVDMTVGKHPSGNGYKVIADELYRYIIENNLLENNNPKTSFLI